MRKRTMMDTVKFQINEINKYLEQYEQRLVLSEEKKNLSNEIYHELYWYRPADKHNEIEEHVFGGDELDLFATLNGIKYGIRMKILTN